MPSSLTDREAKILATSSDPTPKSEIATNKAFRTLISSMPNAVSSTTNDASKSDISSAPIPYSANWSSVDKSIRSPPKAKSVIPNCAPISGLSTPVDISPNNSKASWDIASTIVPTSLIENEANN